MAKAITRRFFVWAAAMLPFLPWRVWGQRTLVPAATIAAGRTPTSIEPEWTVRRIQRADLPSFQAAFNATLAAGLINVTNAVAWDARKTRSVADDYPHTVVCSWNNDPVVFIGIRDWVKPGEIGGAATTDPRGPEMDLFVARMDTHPAARIRRGFALGAAALIRFFHSRGFKRVFLAPNELGSAQWDILSEHFEDGMVLATGYYDRPGYVGRIREIHCDLQRSNEVASGKDVLPYNPTASSDL